MYPARKSRSNRSAPWGLDGVYIHICAELRKSVVTKVYVLEELLPSCSVSISRPSVSAVAGGQDSTPRTPKIGCRSSTDGLRRAEVGSAAALTTVDQVRRVGVVAYAVPPSSLHLQPQEATLVIVTKAPQRPPPVHACLLAQRVTTSIFSSSLTAHKRPRLLPHYPKTDADFSIAHHVQPLKAAPGLSQASVFHTAPSAGVVCRVGARNPGVLPLPPLEGWIHDAVRVLVARFRRASHPAPLPTLKRLTETPP